MIFILPLLEVNKRLCLRDFMLYNTGVNDKRKEERD